MPQLHLNRASRPSRWRWRGTAAVVIVTGALPSLLAGCDAEAVELVQEIQAARQDCSREELRESAEDCVRMMEEYAGMGTELVHTYLGGLRALDMALDRMPPPQFDAGEMGYALSPEFRQGDESGIGGSPRLAPTQPLYSRGPGGAALARTGGTGWTPQASRSRWTAAPRSSRYDDYGRGAYGSYRTHPRDDGRGMLRGGDARERSLRREALEDRRWFGLPGYGRSDGFLLLSPYAYDGYPPYGYGPYGYGSPPRYPYDPYGYAGSPGYLYDPYAYGGAPAYPYDRYGYGGSPAYPYDPYDPYGYGAYSPYDHGAYPPGGAGGSRARTPAEDWGYQTDPRPGAEGYTSPAPDLDEDEPAPAADNGVPDRPAQHRPGILLPPEQRLRRPWLDD